MSVIASQLIGIVTVTGADEGAAKLFGVGKAADSAKAAMTGLAVAGAAIAGAAIIALGAKTVQMAADFQQGVVRLQTGAGDVQDSFNTLSNGIKQVAVNTGTATKPLIDAMYQILSAGQRGAQSLNTLSVAAEGAKIEQASVVDVAKALTTAMTDYGTAQFNATAFMNGYIRAVQLGKLTLEQLSTSMGPLLPLANNLGIHFADVAGAMSTMTNAGIPVERAATSLRFLFQSLENPTKKALTAMKDFGVNSIAVGNELKISLPGALEMVYAAAKKAGPEGSVPFNRAVSDMIGGQRSLQAFLSLTGTHFKTFRDDSDEVATAMFNAKNGVMGWSTIQNNFNQQMDKAKAAMEVLGITIGQALLPVLTKIVSAVTPIITAFTKWITTGDNMKTALAIVAGVLAGLAAIVLAVVVPAMITFVTTMWPILAIGAGVALVVAGAILAFQHWGQITQWVGDQFSKLGTLVHGWVSSVGSAVGGFFNELGTRTRNAMTQVKNDFGNAFDQMGTKTRDVLTGIKNTVGGAFSAIGTGIRDALTGIKNFFGGFFDWLYNHNYYWKAIVDGMPKELGRVKDDIGHILGVIGGFFGATFSAIGTFVHDRLVWIQNTVGAIFSAIGTFIRDRLTWIYNTVGSIFSAIGTFIHGVLTWIQGIVGNAFSWIGNIMRQDATDAKNQVGNAFSSLGSAVQGILGRFGGWIGGFFGGLASQAFSWGANIIQGLINGIGSMFSNLGSMVHNIANTISSALGFHSPPKEGPARDADKWMPNMMAMFAAGIAQGTPALRKALYGALAPVGTSLNVGVSGLSSGSLLPGGVAIPSSSFGGYSSVSAGSSGGVQQINLYLDSYRVGSILMPAIVRNIRNNVGTVAL